MPAQHGVAQHQRVVDRDGAAGSRSVANVNGAGAVVAAHHDLAETILQVSDLVTVKLQQTHRAQSRARLQVAQQDGAVGVQRGDAEQGTGAAQGACQVQSICIQGDILTRRIDRCRDRLRASQTADHGASAFGACRGAVGYHVHIACHDDGNLSALTAANRERVRIDHDRQWAVQEVTVSSPHLVPHGNGHATVGSLQEGAASRTQRLVVADVPHVGFITLHTRRRHGAGGGVGDKLALSHGPVDFRIEASPCGFPADKGRVVDQSPIRCFQNDVSCTGHPYTRRQRDVAAFGNQTDTPAGGGNACLATQGDRPAASVQADIAGGGRYTGTKIKRLDIARRSAEIHTTAGTLLNALNVQPIRFNNGDLPYACIPKVHGFYLCFYRIND